jgi:GT2 family glycosyltransferase
MLLSFVIPTFNSLKFIQPCVESILSQQDPGVEICVVDNGSTDSTPEFVAKNYPGISLIRNQENKGASFARNQGIGASSGEFIVFLDADAFLAGDFLKVLRRAAVALDSRYAGLTAKISQMSTGKIFSCGLRITSLYQSYDLKRGETVSAAQVPCEADGFNSCCAILRRSCLEQARGKGVYFDEDFFFLFEDTDLSLRLRKCGYDFLFDPHLVCSHVGGSAPIDPQKRRFYAFRNRLFIIFKNEKRKTLFFLRSFFYDLPRTLHFCLTNRHASAVWRDISRKFQNEKNTDL